MRTKTKIALLILALILIAGAVLLTLYWKPVSDFFVNSVFNPIGDFFVNCWNSIFKSK